MKNPKTVFVGLSGGVDSSVAALRLIQAGYTVVGVFIKVWHPEWLTCNWEQERLDAMRVAAKLNIPFLTCDAEAAYRDGVAAYFIREYTAGRTPNPDVMCNKEVKFGAFLDFARQHGADYIATGHYTQRIDRADVTPALYRGIDTNKDQSYFLWTLSNEMLAASLFPVGNSAKGVIRQEAAAAGLLTAEKKDSQGICFLGHVNIADFLSHYTTLTPGDVLDVAGNIVGTHTGALVYTIGQRHGFTLNTPDPARAPQYVVARDLPANTITVSPDKPAADRGNTLMLTDIVLRESLTPAQALTIQTRYRQTPVAATVKVIDSTHLTVTYEAAAEAPAIGQSCVLYDGGRCLGGGIIAACQYS